MKPQILRLEELPSTEAALARFYGSRPKKYGLEERDGEQYKNYSRFVRQSATRPDLPCVDLGCGTHRSPLALSHHGFEHVIGLDLFSEADLKRFSAEISVEGVELQTYDGHRLPFETGSVGTVACLCVLEHVPRVSDLLSEIDRVLAPGGSAIIVGPNWAGISSPVRALLNRRRGRRRYWQFETVQDCAFGVVRSIWWWMKLKTTRRPWFILVQPRYDPSGEIDFQEADDDAVHLCQPLSFKYWFQSHRYTVRSFNRRAGNSRFARVFNLVVPGLATTNQLAFEKSRSTSTAA